MNAILFARFVFIAYLALVGFCLYRALHGRPRWYWAAAILLYIMSTLFAWSIGGLTVSTVFVIVGMGIVHAIKDSPRPGQVALGGGIGLIIWAGWLLVGDITWVFWPVGLLFGG